MESYIKKSWHLEALENIKQNPSLMSDDFFFEFRRRQPFKFTEKSDSRVIKAEKPPKSHSRFEKEFKIRPLSRIQSRPSSQCSVRKCSESTDNSFKKDLDTSKIEKTSAKILKELSFLLNKENIRDNSTPTDFSCVEMNEFCKDYKRVSQKISRISRGRVPLKNLKVEMYRKDC